MMLLVAAFACLTAAGLASYPVLAATVFALLLGLVVTVGLCVPVPRALLLALPVALVFVLVALALSMLERDPDSVAAGVAATMASPVLRDATVWAPVLLGGSLLLAASLGAAWCSAGLPGATRATPPARAGRPPLPSSAGGRELAERELAAAAAEGRLLTLGLLGVDEGDELAVSPAHLLRLDEVLTPALVGIGTLCDYGPRERLVILPELWAEDFRETAVQLCRVARQRVGLPVRMALVSFPRDGSRAGSPVDYLERALEVCRAGRTMVSVGRPRLSHLTPGYETLLGHLPGGGQEGGEHGQRTSSTNGCAPASVSLPRSGYSGP